jgi:putative spermidine/putrescine transport system permease protein
MKREKIKPRPFTISRVAMHIIPIIFVAAMLTPLLVIAVMSVGKGWFGARWLPEGLTSQWFTLSLRTVDVTRVMANTIIIGLLASMFSLIFGTPAAWVLSKVNNTIRGILLLVFLIPRMVPPLSYAIGLSQFFYSINLIDTHIGVALSHLAICLPYVVVILSMAFDSVDKRVLDAGRVFGAHGYTLFTRVILPLIMPGIISAGIFAFVISYNEFTMTIMTYGPHTVTMPIMTYSIIGEGYWQLAAAISMIIVVPSLFFLFVILNRMKPEQLLGGVKGA